MIDYPSGHPFWLGKDTREEILSGDNGWSGILNAFQMGHVFINAIKRTPANPDSYMTIIDFERLEEVYKILNDEYAFTQAEWTAFANSHISHCNAQPITTLMGLFILSKFSS